MIEIKYLSIEKLTIPYILCGETRWFKFVDFCRLIGYYTASYRARLRKIVKSNAAADDDDDDLVSVGDLCAEHPPINLTNDFRDDKTLMVSDRVINRVLEDSSVKIPVDKSRLVYIFRRHLERGAITVWQMITDILLNDSVVSAARTGGVIKIKLFVSNSTWSIKFIGTVSSILTEIIETFAFDKMIDSYVLKSECGGKPQPNH